MFVDLRNSTQLAAGRLPFDAIFIVNRYIQAATAAILAEGGHVTSVAGDGVMSVFGLDGDAEKGARGALAAASALGRGVAELNSDLAGEIVAPLRIGVGVHTGPSILGEMGPLDRSSLQFLGDTGNVAARLESLTKDMGCVALISTATWAAAGRRSWSGRRRRFRSGAAARWRRCGSTRWRIWLCWRGREARTKKRTRRFPPPCGRRCKRDSRRRQAPRDARATPLAQQEAVILQKLSCADRGRNRIARPPTTARRR